MQPKLLEVQSVATNDGKVLNFTGTPHLQGFANYGIAPVEYITQEGYKQVGETVRDFRIDSRQVPISLYINSQCTRPEYWELRTKLINIFRPNRGLNRLNELTLSIRFENGEKRQINCFYVSGLEFQDNNQSENAFNISETINLFCANPIWYDDSLTTIIPTATSSSQLVFPITFPIVFGSSGASFNTGELNYAGNFRTFPKITITGPYESANLTLQPNGEQITLSNAIGIGEQRIIELSETGVSIIDENGNSQWGDVSQGDFVQFYIRPIDQYVEGSEQSIDVNLLNGVIGTSTVVFEYRTAYIGI